MLIAQAIQFGIGFDVTSEPAANASIPKMPGNAQDATGTYTSPCLLQTLAFTSGSEFRDKIRKQPVGFDPPPHESSTLREYFH